MHTKSILLVGLHPDAVDYAKWPELSDDKLRTAFEQVRTELTTTGFNAHWCLVGAGPEANDTLADALAKHTPDVVLLGAGVRTDPDHHLLFEQLINTIHAAAPHAKIAFNTSPFDSAEAVARWT